MKFLSSSLAHLACSKSRKYINDYFPENLDRKITVGISKYKIDRRIQPLINLEIKFHIKKTNEEIGFIRIFVLVEISLDKEEIKKGEDVRNIIDTLAVAEAWPIFQSKMSLLKELKIDSLELPPPPNFKK